MKNKYKINLKRVVLFFVLSLFLLSLSFLAGIRFTYAALPTITSIAPDSGNRLQTLDVMFTGTGYETGTTTVDFGLNITINTTTVDSSTSTTANITIAAAAATGARVVSVINAAPGGGTATTTFTVNNPAPTLTSISPSSKTAGTAQFTMTVTGTNFLASSIVRFAGSDRTTTFVNSTQLTATIPATDLTSAGTFNITVFNPVPGGGTSSAIVFTVNPAGGYTPPAPTMPQTFTGQVTATPSTGGKTTLTTPEGTKATVELPAGAVTSDTVVKIEKVETGTIIIASPAPTGQTIVSAFNFTASVGGTAVTSFAKSVTITITYTDAQVAGLNEANLKIYRWDGTQWVALPSVVNVATNTITATTTSFSYVAVMGDSSPVKPITEMTIEELRAEITRITALITQLQSQIAQLQAGVTVPSLCAGITFNRNLSQGAVGNDVKCLQALLNQSPDTKIAVSGVGSPGRETNYFGALTRAAAIKFQEKYRAEILTPLGLTVGTGFVGSSSRAKLNKILGR